MAEAGAAVAAAMMPRPLSEDRAEHTVVSRPQQGSQLGPRYKTKIASQTIVPNYPRSLSRGPQRPRATST